MAVAAIYGTVTYLTNSILPAVVLHTGGNIYSNIDRRRLIPDDEPCVCRPHGGNDVGLHQAREARTMNIEDRKRLANDFLRLARCKS